MRLAQAALYIINCKEVKLLALDRRTRKKSKTINFVLSSPHPPSSSTCFRWFSCRWFSSPFSATPSFVNIDSPFRFHSDEMIHLQNAMMEFVIIANFISLVLGTIYSKFGCIRDDGRQMVNCCKKKVSKNIIRNKYTKRKTAHHIRIAGLLCFEFNVKKNERDQRIANDEPKWISISTVHYKCWKTNVEQTVTSYKCWIERLN